jgi:hypothetical protein
MTHSLPPGGIDRATKLCPLVRRTPRERGARQPLTRPALPPVLA